jgi:hypothetical protein
MTKNCPHCPITQMVECRTVNSDVPGSRPGGAAVMVYNCLWVFKWHILNKKTGVKWNIHQF